MKMNTRYKIILIGIIFIAAIFIIYTVIPGILFIQQNYLGLILYTCTFGIERTGPLMLITHNNGTHTIDENSCTWIKNKVINAENTYKWTTEYKELSQEQQCASSYHVMQAKITQIRQTDFLSVSDYVQELDTLLEIKKDIQRQNCESTAYQWIHLATNTQKISELPEIVIQRTYDNVRTITNNQLVIPQYVVPWKILDYLQQHEIEFTNAPSNNAIQTDEGWRDPTRLCSQLLFTNGTQFYASATFHPDPLSITGIFVDLERPTDCQKYFPIPRGFQ